MPDGESLLRLVPSGSRAGDAADRLIDGIAEVCLLAGGRGAEPISKHLLAAAYQTEQDVGRR